VALATALGRIGLGTGQASSSRYQTPAMIFWGCLLGLSLLWLNKRQNPRGLLALQGGMLLIVIVLAFGVPYTYSVNLARARKLNEACAAVSAGIDDPKLTARLIDQRVVLERAGELLRKLWKPERGPNNSKP
jgi:peptidoglycan/LPS O-acetylase OafA/YrhL